MLALKERAWISRMNLVQLPCQIESGILLSHLVSVHQEKRKQTERIQRRATRFILKLNEPYDVCLRKLKDVSLLMPVPSCLSLSMAI